MLSKKERAFFKKYIEVQKHKLIAKVPLQIVINKQEHPELYDNGEYVVLIGVFDICTEDQKDCLTTSFLFDVNIPKTSVIDETSEYIIFKFQPGDVILEAEYKYIRSDVDALRKILENRVKGITKTVEQRVLTVWKLLQEITYTPLVFVEVWVSELYRDPNDPSQPFRLTKLKDYSKAVPVDIKNAIHSRANIFRNIAHGYTKEGILKAISSKGSTQTDIILQSVTNPDEGEQK